MTKKEFVDQLSKKEGFQTKNDAERALNDVLQTIEECLAEGNDVTFIGWGNFEIVQRDARIGRNPSTGAEIKIAAKKVVKFKAGKKLKEAVQVKVKKVKKKVK